MSSKFAKQYKVPPEFPEILKDFAREVLRMQPANINEFAAKYFDCLASGLPADSQGGGGAAQAGSAEADMSIAEVEGIIQDLFRKYDQDSNCYLDPEEFKALMQDLQQRLDFPPDEILRFLAEADMNADGMVEYEEFIPLALQIIQGMYAKKRLEQHMVDVGQHAEDLLVHGMAREELEEVVLSIFKRMDKDGSGILSKQEFVAALTSMELGLARREINAIMFKVDQDQDGNISYGEFIPFAFQLLQKLTSMRLLETELENDELGQYLVDLFKTKDSEMTGCLHVDDVRDVLHQAMLGLQRMQIYTVISEAELNPDNTITYAAFIPRAVGLIRSMLSFEKSIVKESAGVSAEAEGKFYNALDKAYPDGAVVPTADFCQQLDKSGVLDAKEAQAARTLLISHGEEVQTDQAKAEVWALLKQLRRHNN
jgi:Ca2+-binding EF-hand superfamily protein